MKYVIINLAILLLMGHIAYSKEISNKTGSLYIYSTDNVEMLIAAPDGKKTGKNPFSKESFNQIAGGFYSVEYGYGESMANKNHFQQMKIDREGEYKIKLFSEKGGEYKIEIRSFNADGSGVDSIDKKGVLKPKGSTEIKFFYSLKSKNNS